MTERPEQPPEGRLIALALKNSRLSGRKAADLAGLSEGHWRAIVSGSRSLGTGLWVPVHGPAATVARMAQVVGVTPEQLEEADRADAAEELRQLLPKATEEGTEEEPIDLMKRGRELIEEGNRLIEQAERMLGQRAAGTDETRRNAG